MAEIPIALRVSLKKFRWVAERLFEELRMEAFRKWGLWRWKTTDIGLTACSVKRNKDYYFLVSLNRNIPKGWCLFIFLLETDARRYSDGCINASCTDGPRSWKLMLSPLSTAVSILPCICRPVFNRCNHSPWRGRVLGNPNSAIWWKMLFSSLRANFITE